MPKHKKHHKHGGHSSSSSSSSSSESSDDDFKHLPKHEKKKMKKWKKDYKKGRIPHGTVAPWRVAGYAPGPEPVEGDEDYEVDSCEELAQLTEEEREKFHARKQHKREKRQKKKKKQKERDEFDGVDETDNRPRIPTPPPTDQMPTVTLDGVAETYHPTIKKADGFSVETDVEALKNAMNGTGTEEQTIIDIISNRSNKQRQEIETTYKTMYGKDLVEDLDSELSGNLCETVMALFKSPTFYDAWSLNKAMEGAGTKDSVLIEILCTRSNNQINNIKECYQEHFGRSLEDDITSDTSGYFKRLLVSCCQAGRNELSEEQIQQVVSDGPEAVINRDEARQDAEKLYAAGEKKFGTDESAFIEVLGLRNFYQLTAVFDEYQQLAGTDILDSIDSEMSGNIESGLKAIVRSARNRPEYFAYKLYKAMRLGGTNDSTLIRIIVSRSEIDLADIKEAYEKRYGKTLAAAVESDTSGDYRQLLLSLVRD